MTRLVIGASIWLVGFGLLMYPTLLLFNRTEGRRFSQIMFFDNWHLTLPAVILLSVGYHVISRARLSD